MSRENGVAADQIVTLEQPLPRLRLGVRQGRGTGFYTEGHEVEVEALQPISGYHFSHWSSSGGGTFGDVFSTTTTFVMPADSVTITANYVPGVSPDEDFSVARRWNEALLQSIRNDFARPVVHARNLFHVSAAMYDAWAAYSDIELPWLLGRTRAGETCEFDAAALAVPDGPEALRAAREEAMSLAAYRLIAHRFTRAPVSGHRRITRDIDALMGYLSRRLDFDADNDSADYRSGSPGALGNHVAQCYIGFGMADGANEADDYANIVYRASESAAGTASTRQSRHRRPQPLATAVPEGVHRPVRQRRHRHHRAPGPRVGSGRPVRALREGPDALPAPGARRSTTGYITTPGRRRPSTAPSRTTTSGHTPWFPSGRAISIPTGPDDAECEEGSTESICRGAQRIDISPASLGNIGTESYPSRV